MSAELVPDIGSPVVRTTYGDVRGFRDGATFAWRSVPYAAPVTGRFRFRAPCPPERWEGVRDCTRFGDIAPQGDNTMVPIEDGLRVGEDCLWVNVWSPLIRDDEPRPVLVWLHGGAYCLGTAAQALYEGRKLAERGDVLVVGVNYRLGVLGFVDLSEYSGGEQMFESNLGLRDQIAALRWVRENIAAFGGDPDNVTLFGESAGAGCVTTLMTVPAAAGLFHRAIAQSPPATSVYGHDRAAGVGRRFLELVGLPPADAGALSDVPLDRLIAASDTLVGEVPVKVPGTLATAPVVDGDLVPSYPVSAFQLGRSHRIPLIIGTNRDESSLFRLMRSPLVPVTPNAVNAMLHGVAVDHPELPPERIAEIVSAYPDLSKSRGAMALSTDAAFRMPAMWIADAHAKHSPTWMYRFDHATPMLRAARLGAGHATELAYVFGNFGTLNHDPTFWLGGRKTALEVSGRIQRRWLAFAGFGVPAALDGSKHWTPYRADERKTLVIDTHDTVVADPDGDLRLAWGNAPMGFS